MWTNNMTQVKSIVIVTPIWIFGLKCFKYRLNIGNNENHSTANDNNPNTSRFVSSLEANKTDAKIAALVDNEPGIL